MKKLFVSLGLAVWAQGVMAQVAPLLDPKSFMLPRYNNLTHITSTITAPSEGMLVYNTNTQSAWYYDGVAATWKEINSNFSIPLLISSASTTLQSVASGTNGSAGVFQISNSSNPSPTISTTTMGAGQAIYAQTTGTGVAASISINNSSSSNIALSSSTNGNASSTAIFGQNSGLGRAGEFQINNASNSSASLRVQTSGTGRALDVSSQSGHAGYFTSTSGHALITGTGNAGFGTNTPAAKVEVNGFTKLGSDAPAIKMKELSLTTSSVASGLASEAHGLSIANILSVTVLVEATSTFLVPPSYEADAKLKYTFFVNNLSVFVVNQSSDCSTGTHICSKPVRVLITYK